MGYFCVTYVDAYGGETPCIPQQMAIPGTFNPQDSAPKGAVAFSIYYRPLVLAHGSSRTFKTMF